jgi:hypothetical protein
MLIGGVVGDEVRDHSHPPPVGLIEQSREGAQVAEPRVDRAVINNVEALVQEFRPVEGAGPDRVDAQRLMEIVQPVDDSLQIAHPVSVAVAEAGQLALIEHHLLPPVALLRR